MEIDNITTFRQNFHTNYHKFLLPYLKNFENRRKKKLICAIIWTIVLILASIAYFWLLIKFQVKGDDAAKPGLLLFVLGCSQYWLHKKSFESKLKDSIMKSICKCFGNIKYKEGFHYGKTNFEIFREAGLFPEFTNDYADDAFEGTYKGVNIEFIEAEIERGSGKNSRTVFKGLLIELDMNKNFKGHTLLMEDKWFHKSPLENLKHTELEDVNFEKKYDVFTDDEIEARYILSPTFMERLTAIKTAFKCKAVRCAFYKNQLYIALPTNKDLFALGSLIRPVADPKQFTEFCAQFISVLALIDLLKLDKKAIL